MSKALTTSVFAAVAAFALNGCLGGGMVTDSSEPQGTDTESDTNGTEPTMTFSKVDPSGPLRRDQVAAAKAVPVLELVFERDER